MFGSLKTLAIYLALALTVVLLGYGWWSSAQNDRLRRDLASTRDALHAERTQRAAAEAALASAEAASRLIADRNTLLRGKLHDLIKNDPAVRDWADQPVAADVLRWLRVDDLPATGDPSCAPDAGAADASARGPNEQGAP